MNKNEKIFNIIAENKDTPFPCEIESIITKLGNLSHDVTQDFADSLGDGIELQLALKNIISAAHNPRILKHLLEEIDENQLSGLKDIITILSSKAFEKCINEIVYATLDIKLPTPGSILKANELVDLVKELNLNHKKEALILADTVRLLKTMCYLLVKCNEGEEIEDLVRDRLTMLPENELNWLIKIGVNRLVDND